MALADEGSGEELAEVAEADDADFELGGGSEVRSELRLIVVDLRGVDGSDFETAVAVAAVAAEREGRRWGGERENVEESARERGRFGRREMER